MEDSKKYISTLGYDYTEYVKTEEDIKDFNEICRLEANCKNVPAKDCIHDVAACLNLDRKLRFKDKKYGKVTVQSNIKLN